MFQKKKKNNKFCGIKKHMVNMWYVDTFQEQTNVKPNAVFWAGNSLPFISALIYSIATHNIES